LPCSFSCPGLPNITNDGLAAFPDVDTFNTDDLKAAVPEPAQSLNQDRKRSREPTYRGRCCQDVAVTAVPTPEPTEDGHGGCVHGCHLNHERALVSPRGRSLSIMASAAFTAISDNPLFGNRAAA
jgi:hypothetical protein